MIITLRSVSRLSLAGLALAGLGSLSACISDDSDPGSGGAGGSSAGTGGAAGGATAGSAGSGGSAPAGTACASPIVLSASKPLITDFETYGGEELSDDWSFSLGGDASTGVISGPFGYGDHYVGDMPTGLPETFEMVDGNDSTYALSISDTLAEEYGGGMGLWLSECLNATAFQGISFWVRGNSPTGDAKLIVSMQESTKHIADMPGGKIGTCMGDDMGENATCVHPIFTFEVKDEWTKVEAAWTAMTPGKANGDQLAPDGRNIWQIQFDIGLLWTPDDAGDYQPNPAEYELVIDDVSFY